jgi:hypothetical protein
MATKRLIRRFSEHKQFLSICVPRKDANPTCRRCALITCLRNITPSKRKSDLKKECKDFFRDSKMPARQD